jgi:hypothetical protein
MAFDVYSVAPRRLHRGQARSHKIRGVRNTCGSWLASDGNFTDTTHLSAKKNARRNAWHFL